jgi:hypothetical protein
MMNRGVPSVQGTRINDSRFDDHLNSVEEELALMAHEVHTLRKENEELNAMGTGFYELHHGKIA